MVDISGEGISFATTQRTEFAAMIGAEGMDKFLLQKLIESCKLISKELATT